MDFDYWMGKARMKIDKLSKGDEFVIKDLFDIVDWSKLDKTKKRDFGRHFIKEVRQNKLKFVKCLNDGDGQRGTKRYIKE